MDAGQHHHLHHHHRHQIQQQQEQILLSNTTTSSVNIQGGDTSGGGDRFPQWSIEETRDFVMIRAELDPTFMETKRNKVLWQLIATKMKDKGYHRSAEQCKCKWKNLVTRYKGCETMEPEGLMKQQFPFYNELQTIFAARMQRMLWNEAEGSGAGGGGGSNKKKNAQLSSDDDEEDESDEDGDHKGTTSVKKKRKTNKHTVGSTSINNTTNVGSDVNKNVKEMLEDFMKQQIQMEMQWMKAYEAREEERRIREMEWRQKMEALEKERMMMERRWREREEQTRVREEARAEKRDALINALLNKLRREDNIS